MTSSSAELMGKKDRNEEIVSERKAAGKKKKKSKHKSQSPPGHSTVTPADMQSNNTTGAPTFRTHNKEATDGIPLTPVCTATGTPSKEVRINMEDSDSTLPESLSSTSVRSELSINTPNVTPPSSPLESRSVESLTNVTPLESRSVESLTNVTPLESRSADTLTTFLKTSASQSDNMTCSNLPPSPVQSVDNLTLEDETGSTPVTAQSARVTDKSSKEVPNSNLTDSFSIPKDAEEQTNPVAMETGATNSSNESCKTPVAPCSDIMITVEDDDESKSPLLISENESSSAEVIYARNESETDTIMDMDDKHGPRDETQEEMVGKFPTDESEQFVNWSFLHFLLSETRKPWCCVVFSQYSIKVLITSTAVVDK